MHLSKFRGVFFLSFFSSESFGNFAYMDTIEMKFIEQTLRNECDKFKKNHTTTIMRRFYDGDRSQTNRLAIARTFKVSENKLTFTFPIYLRFLDMQKILTKRGKLRPSASVYNTFAYGVYFSTAKELMYGLTDEVRELIKREWQTT